MTETNLHEPTKKSQPVGGAQTPAFVAVRAIPIEAFGAHHGRQTRKFVLSTLASHADNNGTNAWPSQSTLASEVGLTDRGLRKVIVWLEQHKFLSINYKSHRVRRSKDQPWTDMVNEYTIHTRNGSTPGTEASPVAPGTEASSTRNGSVEHPERYSSSNHQLTTNQPQEIHTHESKNENLTLQEQDQNLHREQGVRGQGPVVVQPAGTNLKTQRTILELAEQACIEAGVWGGDYEDDYDIGWSVVWAISRKLERFPDADPVKTIPRLILAWQYHMTTEMDPESPLSFFNPNLDLLKSPLGEPSSVQETLIPVDQHALDMADLDAPLTPEAPDVDAPLVPEDKVLAVKTWEQVRKYVDRTLAFPHLTKWAERKVVLGVDANRYLVLADTDPSNSFQPEIDWALRGMDAPLWRRPIVSVRVITQGVA
jgi:hypothetical protein